MPKAAYRLWPASQRLEPQRRPEIAQVELAGPCWNWPPATPLRFVDPPLPGALAAARSAAAPGALDDQHRITSTGRRMLALGTHPRLAAMLLAARDGDERALACDLAALVEARDPLRGRDDGWRARWAALAAFRAGRTDADAHRATLAAIDTAARQWRRRLGARDAPPREAPAHALGDLLAHAFPDRIGRVHPRDPQRYLPPTAARRGC